MQKAVQMQQPTDPEIQADMERYRADARYFDEHRAELLQQYPDQWVAVYLQEVVGAARDTKRLVKQLERKGIRPGRTYHEYVTAEVEDLFLPAVPGFVEVSWYWRTYRLPGATRARDAGSSCVVHIVRGGSSRHG
jgi:hypothetical protein